jgi:Carboxypeptidase regulatory-like domain
MPRRSVSGIIVVLLLCSWAAASGQTNASHGRVVLTVVDENGLPVPGAQVTVSEPGRAALQLQTDYAGRCSYLNRDSSYQLLVKKPGFYQAAKSDVDAQLESIQVALAYEQIVRQQVDVVASPTGIDPEQTSDKSVMNTAEIVNIPYTVSRDISGTCFLLIPA